MYITKTTLVVLALKEIDWKDAGHLGQEDPLEKEVATYSSILAGIIPWTEEPGGLQSVGSQSQMRLPLPVGYKVSLIPT